MKSLVNDNNPAVDSNKPVTELDTFLSGYTAPMVINPGGQSNGNPAVNPLASKPVESVLQNVEQAVYKTGKKAGQPKPNQGKAQQAPAAQPQVNSVLISGALFIMIVDFLLPVVIAFVHNKTNKNRIEPQAIKLTDQQKKEIEPLCDQVVKYLNLNANPLVLLMISLGGAYSMGYMAERGRVELAARSRKTNPYDSKK